MIILNFSPAPPITDHQRGQIRASILDRLDQRFIIAPLEVRIFAVPQCPTVETTLDACGLTPGEWKTQPIAPRITQDHPFAGALLAACNERRGYDWPVIRAVVTR